MTKEAPVLEEFAGIPAHPLLIHAAVVFVPLLAILAIAYAFVPFIRPHTRWVLGLLALATPVSALLSKLSGDAFFARLDSMERISPEYYPRLEAHQDFGNLTLYATIALAVLALALVYLVPPRGAGGGSNRVLALAVRVLTPIAAVASLYYVVRAGDSGAQAVWNGF
jgi:hypothetical protein